ncbi:MAG TPA: glutaminyl-peptide cyclotransferase, partial [Edaphobacter sp.]
GWIDCTGLLPASQKVDDESVLNGIAYDAAHRRLYVTGKQWPTIFEIHLPPALAASSDGQKKKPVTTRKSQIK